MNEVKRRLEVITGALFLRPCALLQCFAVAAAVVRVNYGTSLLKVKHITCDVDG